MKKRRWMGISLALLLICALWFFHPTPVTNRESSEAPTPLATDAMSAQSPKTHERTPPFRPPGAPTTMEDPPKTDNEIRAEMKTSLLALYTAEKSFFAEYHRYSTDFNAIGYLPAPTAMYVKVGFARSYEPADPLPEEREPVLSSEDLAKVPMYQLHFAASARDANFEEAIRYCRDGCTASEQGFELVATAMVNGKQEFWSINEKKELREEATAFR